MKIFTNSIFDSFANETDLSWIFQHKVILPVSLEKIIQDELVVNKYGIGFKSSYIPCENPDWYGQSYYEDDRNHFHTSDWIMTAKEVFIYWTAMVYYLVLKFKMNKVTNTRIWFSFQDIDMSINWHKKNSIYDKNDFYSINDRVSFYMLREWEMPISELEISDLDDTAIIIVDL